jgi:hypothetical protein
LGLLTSAHEPDFDARAPDKQYVHHVTTGDRGTIVETDEGLFVRLDRVNQEILKPYHEHEWIPEESHRPMTMHSAGQVSYEADMALRRALGMPRGGPEWISLREPDKLRWIRKGPQDRGPREKLYKAIRKALAPLVED